MRRVLKEQYFFCLTVLMDNTVSLLYGFLSFSLNYVIVRPAIMYGIADRQGLSKFTLVNI